MPPGPTLDRGGETRRARATWWTMTLINAGPGRSRRASAPPPPSRAASPAPLACRNVVVGLTAYGEQPQRQELGIIERDTYGIFKKQRCFRKDGKSLRPLPGPIW